MIKGIQCLAHWQQRVLVNTDILNMLRHLLTLTRCLCDLPRINLLVLINKALLHDEKLIS